MPNTGDVHSTDIQGQTFTTKTTGGDLLSQLQASYGPQAASSALQFNQGEQQLSQLGPELQANEAYQAQMAGYQQGGLGIAAQRIGLGQQANQQAANQANTQQGFEQQQFNIQQGQYPEQQAEAALAYQNALRNTQGAQAISGTQNTVGGKADVSTLNQNYGFQQQDIARSQALSQLGQKSELSGFQYSEEQLANASKNLSLNAQANGLSQDQLLTALQYGQSQAGIGAVQQAQGIEEGQAQDLISLLAAGGPALSQAGFAGGFNALANTSYPTKAQ